jgi:hypothetical protein
MQAGDMCSECVNPARHSPGRYIQPDRLEFYWRPVPGMAAFGQKVEMVRRALREKPARPTELPAPKPRPIAVIADGTPIEDVIVKLTAIKADHPDAQIRQGKRNRLEIWPSSTDRPASGMRLARPPGRAHGPPHKPGMQTTKR